MKPQTALRVGRTLVPKLLFGNLARPVAATTPLGPQKPSSVEGTRVAAFRVLAYLALASLAMGCGPSFYKVKGNIVKNGAPVMPDKGFHYQVSFYPLDANGAPEQDAYPANQGSEPNSFTVPGKSGKGIPGGRYRIGIRMTDTLGEKDRLKEAFGRENSPIIRDIHSADELVIDLAKPGG